MQQVYYRVSEEFVLNSLSNETFELLRVPCLNLSAMIGDFSGKIPLNVIILLLGDLNIVYPGTIITGETEGLSLSISDSLDEIVYTPEVSTYAYNLLSSLSKRDESVTYIKTNLTSIYTPILYDISEIEMPRILRIAIKALYMELFALYLELLNCTLGTGLPSIVRQDIKRMDTNIRWISFYIEKIQTSESYRLIQVLRDAQRTLMHIRSMKQIFGDTYKTKLSVLSNIGGVE